jgi:hypothetical protein
MADTGRPPTTDATFETWLEEMKPFLKAGNSIWYAMEKAGITQHAFVIYEKYRSKDWFSQKIDRWRALPGELVNEIFYTEVNRINEKVKKELPLTREEIDVIKHFSEKHRTAQPFFVSRVETAQVDPNKVGNILDELESGAKTDYGSYGQKIAGQSVANDAPVQNQG